MTSSAGTPASRHQIVLVQGASRGIGLALVARLLQVKTVAHVYATSRQPERSEALAALADQHPDTLTCLPLDVTREDDVARAANEVRSQHNTLHGLINCAGLLHEPALRLRPEKRVEQLNSAALEAVFRVNTFGPMLMARHFAPLLMHDQAAVFASVSARVGSISDNHLGGWYTYRASKAALNQFTRTFAIEMRRRAPHLVVLALHPGTTNTQLSRPFQKNVPEEKLFEPDFVAERLLRHMMTATPQDSGRFMAWDGQDIPW